MKYKAIFFFIGITSILAISACNKHMLHPEYCDMGKVEYGTFSLRLDTSSSAFAYIAKVGMLDDTLKGKFTLKGKRLALIPSKGAVELKKKQSTDRIHIQVLSLESHEPVPFAIVGIGSLEQMTDETGRISFEKKYLSKEFSFQSVGYGKTSAKINETGTWEVLLSESLKINKDRLKWRVGKEEVSSGKFTLYKCE